jgi:HD superfamily phosphodiesterase
MPLLGTALNTARNSLLTSYAQILSCLSISGIARCFTFGGSRSRVLHDPTIQPRSDLSKEQYVKKDEQTTVNHFHEKLLKLKDLMKTKVKANLPALVFLIICVLNMNLQMHVHY